MNRRERRAAGDRGHRTVLIGQGITAVPTGRYYDARPMAKMPDKVPGKHRWIVMACYILGDDQVVDVFDPAKAQILDQEVMYDLSVGCWDCERQLGPGPNQVTAGSRCHA